MVGFWQKSYIRSGDYMTNTTRPAGVDCEDRTQEAGDDPQIDRRTALRNIGALAGAAPAVALLLTPSASRAWGRGGSPCEGHHDHDCGGGGHGGGWSHGGGGWGHGHGGWDDDHKGWGKGHGGWGRDEHDWGRGNRGSWRSGSGSKKPSGRER